MKTLKHVIIAACACAIAFGCKKKATEAKPTSATLSFSFIKYWKPDTLRNNLATPPSTDSFYSFKHGDTSGIIYHGTTLYIFCISNLNNVNDTTKGSIQCYFGPIAFDTASSWSQGYAAPYQYWNIGDAKYGYQAQSLSIANRSPHFLTTGTGWYFGSF